MSTRPLELIHMDLFGPTKTKSLNGSRFAFVLVDDFSRFTWVFFLQNKDQTFSHFKIFRKRVEKEKGFSILRIRSDRGGEFNKQPFTTFCKEHEISMNYLALELHNKMELLRGKIEHYKKWLGQ